MIANPAVRWLLGIEGIPADAADVRLAFERPIPAWGWLLVLVLAVGLAWLSYRRLDVNRVRRVVLGSLRAGTVMLLALLAAGPVLELPRERREPDTVIVLADRSRSMEVADMTQDGVRVTRDAVVRELLTGPDYMLSDAGDAHRVQWYGFAESLTPLQPVEAGAAPAAPAAPGAPGAPGVPGVPGVPLGDAVGDRTLIATTLEQAISRAGGRPISAVVLLSDGRTTDPPDAALLNRLASDGVQVICVAIGADEPIGDIAVVQSQAPRRAFARDLVPVEATIERRGPALEREARVQLVDTATGMVLDQVELPAGGGARASVTLVARPGGAGDTEWEVRVSDASGAQDLVPANDRRSMPVTLVDRPVRALYVEGYPRWEYRYLKNLMQRESTIESAVMLLSADRDFAQEGNTPITRLPRTREEFERFDLIVIGDVGAGFFTDEQLREMRRLVSDRGAGLVWIGGARQNPRSWQGSPLEDLLPFTGPLELERLATAVNMQPTPSAQRLGVLRLADDQRSDFPPDLLDASVGWSQLEWAQRIPAGAVKPTAEVLGESVQLVDGERAPLVMTMRYGAGSVLYVATDEIWRWRYGRGETYPERFWLQLLRMLARPALASGRDGVQIAAEPGRATVGDTVRVEVELPAGVLPESITLEAVPDSLGGAPVDMEAKLNSGGTLVATWTPESEGRWTIKPRDPTLAAQAGTGGQVQVVRSDRELRNAESDRAMLQAIAQGTGGRVVSPSQARRIASLLPNRSIVTEDPLQEPLWSSPLALAAFLSMLVAEWVGRRVCRLA